MATMKKTLIFSFTCAFRAIFHFAAIMYMTAMCRHRAQMKCAQTYLRKRRRYSSMIIIIYERYSFNSSFVFSLLLLQVYSWNLWYDATHHLVDSAPATRLAIRQLIDDRQMAINWRTLG